MYSGTLIRRSLQNALRRKIDSPEYSFVLPPLLGRAPLDRDKAAWLGGSLVRRYVAEVLDHQPAYLNYPLVLTDYIMKLLRCDKTLAFLMRKIPSDSGTKLTNADAAFLLKVFVGLLGSCHGPLRLVMWQWATLTF
ncbi:hypothetical protein Hypma_001369 [Hypsizygus marmoreus]|uniref:Uncharacterized protein n=1 Tax=Hypsizygus marmoreus TaxID=39966 RepID=A0A369K8G3_HYPMA|nr:hypothetical protein Hypma_001369 [Hypsizygus marmoreus]